MTSFTVRNHSGEGVHITPIGTVGKEGHRRLLPLSSSARLSIPASTASDFYLAPNEERRFTYDCDDINFSEIAVRDHRGNWRQIVVDPTPTERQYHRPPIDVFSIPPLSELPKATEAVHIAASQRNSRVAGLWLIALFGLLPPALVIFCLKRLRAIRANENTHR